MKWPSRRAEGVGMLFGHQNDDANQPTVLAPAPDPTVNPLAVDPTTGASLPTVAEPAVPAEEPGSVLNQAPSAPTVLPATETPETTTPFTAPPVEEAPAPAPEPIATAPEPTPAPASTAAPDNLLALKQQALSQLSPLVGHLDQTPEERFRTTMMLIQSTDNQELLQTAYDAAQAISDEKARAQALLDVINEINYFTQQSQQTPSSN